MKIVFDTNLSSAPRVGRTARRSRLFNSPSPDPMCRWCPTTWRTKPPASSRTPRVRELFRSTEVERAAFLDVYYAAAERFEPTSTAAVTADPADDPIAALAMQSGAEVLVTLDKHFHDPEARTRLEAAGVRVMTDAELLQWLRSEPEA